MKMKIISQVKKWFFFDTTINITFLFTVGSLGALKILLMIDITPSEQAHYYFFSSVAQSMAAIIALAGSVGVFSYSHICDKLKRLKQLTRESFDSRDWVFSLGLSGSLTWHDNEVIEKARSRMSTKLRPEIGTVLSGLIKEMESLQKLLDDYIANALPSLISSSVSFFMSLSLLPFSTWMTKTKLGSFFIAISLFTVIISLRNIYGFFKSTLLK